MNDTELYVSGAIGFVAVVVAAFLWRSPRGEQAMKIFGGGPLRLTGRAVALWIIGLGVCVAAFAISKLM
jgi:hypothetical protein